MNRKNLKLIKIIFPMLIVLLMLFAVKYGYQDAIKTDLSNTFSPMSRAHLFGTDHLGRDIFSLMVDGAQRTLLTIFIASSIGLFAGVPMGAIGGYFGGTTELIIKFITDLLMIVPSFILALILASFIGLNPLSAGITIGISGIGDYANQAMILAGQIKNKGYIVGGRSLGLPSLRMIAAHAIPNILPPILTSFGNRASSIALQYASLSFIGLGADLTKPDWGSLLYQYRVYIIDRPNLLFWPAFSIFILAYGFHLFFDSKEV